ncbi:MAG: HPr family phosphocarrier protein [Phycisphaerae bacterium]|nr:HPr family phosphocarrier protein [Phycisphaerae bacterium]
MPVVEQEVTIINKFGLHARPAMSFVKLANQFACSIEVSKGALVIDGKSIMSIMRLAATKGTKLKITADGQDAGDATCALEELVKSGFGE